jgi:hypothetical protein
MQVKMVDTPDSILAKVFWQGTTRGIGPVETGMDSKSDRTDRSREITANTDPVSTVDEAESDLRADILFLDLCLANSPPAPDLDSSDLAQHPGSLALDRHPDTLTFIKSLWTLTPRLALVLALVPVRVLCLVNSELVLVLASLTFSKYLLTLICLPSHQARVLCLVNFQCVLVLLPSASG